MKTKLGILLPTNNPKEFHECLGPSVQYLVPLLKHADVAFLINFQPPWDGQSISIAREYIHELGFKTHATLTEQRPYSAYVLRQQCADLWREADYYMLCDDNVIFSEHGTTAYPFSSAQRYHQVLRYFATFPTCGVVTCEGSLGGAIQRTDIRPTTSAIMATARGLFFRNIWKGQIHTEHELTLKGGLGESILAYKLMEYGYYIAKQFNNPTRHLHLTKARARDGRLINDERFHGEALAYIRLRWNDRWWTHSSGKFPQGLLQKYRDVGGDMRAIAINVNPQIRSQLYWKEFAT